MNYLIDLLIIVICIIPIIIFSKKGFVYALVRVVGFLAALILATSFGDFLSDYLCEKVILPKFVSSVKTDIDKGVDNVADSVFDALPKFIRENSEVVGLTKDNITDSLTGEVVTDDNITQLFEVTVEPVVKKILSTAITLVAFVIMLFLVALLSKLLNKLFSFSVAGKLNRTLGGIIGLPIGVIFAVVFCLLIEITLSFTSKGLWIFEAKDVSSSKLYNLLMSIF